MGIRSRWRQAFSRIRGGRSGTIGTTRPQTIDTARTTSLYGWEHEAWELYRRVPEVRQAVRYKASAISRMRLFLGRVTEDGSEPTPIPDKPENERLLRPLRQLLGGATQRPDLLHQWSRLLNVADCAYITAVLPTTDEAAEHGIPRVWQWRIISRADRGTPTGDRLTLRWPTPRGTITRDITIDREGAVATPPDTLYIHDSIGDAEHRDRPDSPVAGILEPAETLMHVSDSVNATALSRLTGAGLLILADDVGVPGAAADTGADPDVWALTEKGARDMQHRRSARARMPLVMRGTSDRPPAEQVHYQQFSSDYDQRAIEIMQAMGTRIAVGMDTPVEAVTGFQDSNHWNALYTGQDGVRVHMGPEITHMCRVITQHWLWRYYRDELKLPDWHRYMVWWDASALTQNPDKSGLALSLWEAGGTDLIDPDEVREPAGLPARGTTATSAPAQTGTPRSTPRQPVRNLNSPVTPAPPQFPTPPPARVNGST